jgi:radical SAM-linked protein
MSSVIAPYRLWYFKKGRERFLSHLDVARLFARAVRRAGLPVRFSEGFSPRPLISFPLALGIGIESLDEIVEIELSESREPGRIQQELNAQLPEGIRILRVEPFARKERLAVESVEYEVVEPPAPADLADKVERTLAQKEVWVHRERGEDSKPVDIRPFLGEIRAEAGHVVLVLKVTDRGSARPHEVLQALGIEGAAQARILKRKTNLSKVVHREGSDADQRP